MATRTRTGNRAGTTTHKSKSDHLRALITDPEFIALNPNGPLAAAAEKVGMGYAFAYGVMTRYAKSNPDFDIRSVTSARQAKSVTTSGDLVTIVTPSNGTVIVDKVTGKVTRRK